MLSSLLSRSRISPKSAIKTFPLFSARRSYHMKNVQLPRHFTKGRQTYYGLSLAGLTALWAINNQSRAATNDANVNDDAENTVTVDKSVTPFEVEVGPPKYPLSTVYSLLGYGFRYVTFISFKVYVMGIYIANEDKHLVPEVLSSKFLSSVFVDTDHNKSHKENVSDAMNDPEKSAVLVGNLLDTGCRMLAKLTPVRNTDFNHLRDGLIRTILTHPEAKNNQEALNTGFNELKEAFTKKGKVPKDHDLLLELQANGSLQLAYYDRKKDNMVKLGLVNEPLVGKFLFSQYMGGPKPLSPSTQKSIAEHIVTMV
ncbi:altered inheritance of mitochondria protein 18 mitochondrial [Zygosaccharomyces mellis]|uniref:Altered inheritance of mitochondria protein 18, mitochondrial n=1 Tax=Zygosaccharomyces mellis TaxID=42258 RepID=A0A4C2E3R3_9SACH|nr:altered inheritance of mitochondria protein 18 mitochondrial [Zygosaccharomyces mellis]